MSDGKSDYIENKGSDKREETVDEMRILQKRDGQVKPTCRQKTRQ